MTALKRINTFITGLFMILAALLFLGAPDSALPIVTTVMALTLFIYGIRMFIYYFTLARHMTGGLSVLFRAAVFFDIGLFAVNLPDFPLIYVMIYLAAIHGFAGIANVLKAIEAKRIEAPAWKLDLFHGIMNVAMAVLCLAYSKSISTAVMIYSFGLLNSGVIRIIQAFRKTASVYVQ